MDYTLAIYKSPDFESMAFDLIVNRMISIGYPEDLKKFVYNPIFSVRGLWFDQLYGNLLKVDGFGNILVAVHGFDFLTPSQIEELYPNKFIHLNDKRIYVLNTLFNLPETYLVACLVNYFNHLPEYNPTSDRTGLKCGDMVMSYKSIFQDIRSAVDWAHFDSEMKSIILNNLDKYVEKDDRIKQLLTQLRESDRRTFLLTNSDYPYTNGMMTYLIGPDWPTYFDIAIVDARKPLWFAEGTVFREVDANTGALKIGIHTGPLKKGAVYSGGSCDAFRQLFKVRGKDVLYIGDHIFGDVLRSKKARGWHTFLVVPELNHELTVWTDRKPLFENLGELDSLLADIYKNLDGKTRQKPEISNILESIKHVTYEMDQEYGIMGSLFRSGSRTTFFASQVERFADLYASSCYNLVHYPTFYMFRAPMTLMPHESTVDHSAKMRPQKAQHINRQDSVGQQVRGWNKMMSKSSTFCYEEEEDTRSSGSDADGQDSARQRLGIRESESEANFENGLNGAELNDTDVIVPNPSHVDKPL
uniref:Cytosolic purine 5'-nucleotidase n=1 Tax=Acrobeloides nanus TaxID=290746 RepID=A0A914DX80_9BILA